MEGVADELHWVGFGGKDGDELESRYRGLERAERGHLVARVPRDCADYVGELLFRYVGQDPQPST